MKTYRRIWLNMMSLCLACAETVFAQHGVQTQRLTNNALALPISITSSKQTLGPGEFGIWRCLQMKGNAKNDFDLQ